MSKIEFIVEQSEKDYLISKLLELQQRLTDTETAQIVADCIERIENWAPAETITAEELVKGVWRVFTSDTLLVN